MRAAEEWTKWGRERHTWRWLGERQRHIFFSSRSRVLTFVRSRCKQGENFNLLQGTFAGHGRIRHRIRRYRRHAWRRGPQAFAAFTCRKRAGRSFAPGSLIEANTGGSPWSSAKSTTTTPGAAVAARRSTAESLRSRQPKALSHLPRPSCSPAGHAVAACDDACGAYAHAER